MAEVASYPLPRERNFILAALLALAAVAWGLLIWQATASDQEMSLTMGMGPAVFIGLWIAMMVAIMFPTAAPMILMFARIHSNKRQRGQAFVPTWAFAGAYLLVWSFSGLLAYGLAVAGDELAKQSAWAMDNAGRIGGVVIVLAGLYQLSPLKRTCLSKCRTPLDFILGSWRDGYVGAVRMGIEHGLYCFGCCWLLFAILFPLGMMNIAVLALVTLLIFAEKSLPIGRQAAAVAALAMVSYGTLVAAVAPDLLPTVMA